MKHRGAMRVVSGITCRVRSDAERGEGGNRDESSKGLLHRYGTQDSVRAR